MIAAKLSTHHEDVVGVLDVSAAAEELQQVEELAVDVAADRHGAAHGLHVGLLNEQQLDHLAHLLELQLAQHFAVAQVLDPLVGAAAAARELGLLQRHVAHARHSALLPGSNNRLAVGCSPCVFGMGPAAHHVHTRFGVLHTSKSSDGHFNPSGVSPHQIQSDGHFNVYP
ncbi:unnamed protein product [Phytophthora fragariaefolia]|uniref:Unnamed protein product n=1 Tax=Phytophthora fragariaefolia TaxID=1490495 RepID=A0A9W6U6T3_9STRA|nr:unnamed protein product [Phytophthora fragariaefolia]